VAGATGVPVNATSLTPPVSIAVPPDGAGRGAGESARNDLVRLCTPRARTVIECVDAGFEVVKRRPRTMVLVALPFVVPVDVIAALVERGINGTRSDSFFTTTGAFLGASAAASVTVAVLVVALRSLSLVFIAASVAHVLSAGANGGDLRPADALRAGARRAPALVAAWAAVHLIEVAGLLAVGIGAVIASGFLVLTVPTLAVEHIGPFAAVRRSIQLTRPQLGRAIGFVLLSGFAVELVSLVANAVPLAIAGIIGPDVAWPIVTAGTIVTSMLLLPVLTASTTFFYFDLRVRLEGLDLELEAIEHFGPADG
jgi:hypothetical protein